MTILPPSNNIFHNKNLLPNTHQMKIMKNNRLLITPHKIHVLQIINKHKSNASKNAFVSNIMG